MEELNMNKRHSILNFKFIFLFLLPAFQMVGQDTLNPLTTIGVGAFKPTITNADKVYDSPVVKDSTQKIPVGKYTINSKKLTTDYAAEPIPAAQISNDPLTKLYNGLVKVGFGNYNTPYGEVWYN